MQLPALPSVRSLRWLQGCMLLCLLRVVFRHGGVEFLVFLGDIFCMVSCLFPSRLVGVNYI